MQLFNRRTRAVILISCLTLLSACNSNVGASAWTAPTTTGGATGGTTGGATASASSATLSWVAPTQNTDGTPLTDISGYHVYLGTDPNNLTATADLTDASATSYTVTHLSPGKWYFAISAYNAKGTDGDLSNVGSKTIA
jgi:hypothetical protein